MPAVFINYRTGDEETSAALIESELSRRFGAAEVFLDSTTIRPGDDFERVILAAVRRSQVLLAVIGPRWITAPDGRGGRALDREDDWIRREVREALACGIRIIPVLIGDTGRLDAAALPAELQPLARFSHMRLHHRRAAADLHALVTELAGLVPDLRQTRRPDLDGPGVDGRVVNHFHSEVDASFANFGIKL